MEKLPEVVDVYPEPMAQRPGMGRLGRPGEINVNYFPISFDQLGTIHHYDVTITPEVPPLVNKEVFGFFESQHRLDREVLDGIAIVFDGMKNAFTPRALPIGPSYEVEFAVPERGGRPNPRNPRIFKLKLVKVNEIKADIAEMHRRSNSGLTAIMAYNILFRHQPDTKFVQVRDSFFIREDVRPLANGVEVWPGFFRSFMPVGSGLALNVDTIVCTFYKPGNLLDTIAAFVGLRHRDELRDPRLKDHLKRIKSFIKNLRVTLNYRGDNPKEHKIRDLSMASADNTKFTLVEEGVERGETTVTEYFARKMGVRLDFPMLPCVEIKRGVLIPLELCDVIPGQRYARKLNEVQTADMIKITCVPPKVRAGKIMSGLKLMAPEKNDHLRQFGLRVEPRLMQVPSRLLPVPMIHYHGSSREKSLRPVDGAWNLRDKKLFEGKELKVWSVVVFHTENRVRRNVVETFIKEHVATCISTGLNIVNDRPKIYYAPPRAATAEKALQDIYVSTGNEFKARPQMLFCILPDKGAELYNAIKAACELGLGIPTQCVQSDKIFKPNRQYSANVCLKMNAKLGGINAAIHPSELGDLKSPSTLIIGADLSHPSPGSDEAPSITACIGSIDFSACRFASSVRVQKGRVAMIMDLQSMVVELLKLFFRGTGSKPARILYFRDGVSEGQFQQVLCTEMMAIKRACASLEAGYSPTVTFTLTQKRHHTRFFPMKQTDQDRSGNCKAGTIVESGICHPHYFDFFLQAHSGLQGTSRPIHYHVLIDENKHAPDALQSLCYNMCYLFTRATRAVSLIPPIYYAHLAAERARAHYKIADSSDSASMSSSAAAPSNVHETRRVGPELMKVMYYV
ncbi:hypothetical protein DSO57_1035333 [Entomophthora muscae]|uniref:Uncharacterized protein n=1 Tax=Entomophthora muscae TaxID=34485 RepID=A0ACC2U9E7_9FUNG|nr:hypothetical protein DSO57_1035333 [Entomophthora muscae]